MNDSILITFFDLLRLAKRLLGVFKYSASLLFCLALCYFLCQKPQYIASATFKHLTKQSDTSAMPKEVFKELSMAVSTQVPIFSVMHSNRVLKGVVEKLGMQIKVKEEWTLGRAWNRALDSLINELGRKPSDPDTFVFRQVLFEGEKALRFFLQPLDGHSYRIFNAKREAIAVGTLGTPLLLPECHFTLLSFPKTVERQKLYLLTVQPWVSAIDGIKRQFEIREHKIEKNVFYLYYKHHDRKLAAEFLNSVMESYQDYFHKENEEICQVQVAYLEKRQKELIREFDAALREHVTYLENTIAESGCVGFSNALSALVDPQNAFNAKLFDVDLELKRIESLYAHRMATPPHIELKTKLDESLLQCDLEEKRFAKHAVSSTHSPDDVLTLESAKALYVQYSEKKDACEAQFKQHMFLRDQLNDPDFELSSLATFLTDPVSLSLVQNGSTLALKLRDGENRTTREQERLKEELDLQKNFLRQHLSHMIELEQIQIDLLTHKIFALQLQTRHLLDAEKQLLHEKIEEFKQKMSSLPEKWHREHLLSLKKDLGARVLSSMTQLVETKNLNQKLYQAASKQLDLAHPPLKPIAPRITLHALLVAFAGCFVHYLCALCRLLCVGLPVSSLQLKHLGLFSAGTLTRLCHLPLHALASGDLETVRGLAHFISSLAAHSCVALLHGKNPACAHALGEMLSYTGKKILTVQQGVDQGWDLGAYLRKEIDEIPIIHNRLVLAPLQSPELLQHPDFQTLLENWKAQYDHVIVCSDLELKSNASHLFFQYADGVILVTHNESYEDLEPYRRWADTKGRLAFACFE